MTATTVTLNLSPVEMQALDQLCDEHQMSKTGVIRQALRMYQYLHMRMKYGEHITLSGDAQRALDFVGPGFGQDLRNPTPASRAEGYRDRATMTWRSQDGSPISDDRSEPTHWQSIPKAPHTATEGE